MLLLVPISSRGCRRQAGGIGDANWDRSWPKQQLAEAPEKGIPRIKSTQTWQKKTSPPLRIGAMLCIRNVCTWRCWLNVDLATPHVHVAGPVLMPWANRLTCTYIRCGDTIAMALFSLSHAHAPHFAPASKTCARGALAAEACNIGIRWSPSTPYRREARVAGKRLVTGTSTMRVCMEHQHRRLDSWLVGKLTCSTNLTSEGKKRRMAGVRMREDDGDIHINQLSAWNPGVTLSRCPSEL
ncbi:hypothetical protein J3F84DRAFT_387437 [Trichoderma pleuroticola]